MNIIKSKNQKLFEKFFFIKNKEITFNLIELENEFGIEDDTEYLEYMNLYLSSHAKNMNNIYLVVTIFKEPIGNVIGSKIVESQFKKLNWDIQQYYDFKEKTVYFAKYNNKINENMLKNLSKYQFTLIVSNNYLISSENLEINDTFNYQINYDKLLSDIELSNFIVMSKLLTSDVDVYFIIDDLKEV